MANPYLIGSQADAAGASTTVISAGTSSNSNDAIVVTASVNSSSSDTASSVTDSKGNSYSLADSDTAGRSTWVFTSLGTTALVSGTDTITIHWSGTTVAHSGIATGCPNVLTASALDVTPVNSGTSTTPSVSSGTLAQASEVLIASVAYGNAGGASPTWGGGFTGLGTAHQGTGQYTTVGYDVVASTAAVTPSVTITSALWTIVLISLKLNTSTAGSASLSGTGSLSASPVFAGTGSMSGQGTLSALEKIGWNAALSGQGSLSASPAFSSPASLSGQGSLSASPVLPGAASLSGQGSLSATEKLSWSAGLSGAGTLGASPALAGAASLSGSGSLSASPALSAAAGLSGQGSLSASPVRGSTASLSGAGTLSGSPVQAGAATLSGSGTLSATYAGPITLTNNFEGGSNGVAITTSDTGSGTPWDALGGSATLPVYTTTTPLKGSVSALTPLSANSTTTLEWSASFAGGFNSSSIPWYCRDYFRITSLPPAQVFLMKAQDVAAPQDVWAVYIDTSGHLGLRNRIAGSNLATSTGTVATNTPTRWESQCSYNGSTYSLTLRCFFGGNVDGTTPDETLTGSVSSADPVDTVAYGAQAASVQTWSGIEHDSIVLTNTTWPGPDTSVSVTISGSGTLSASPAFTGAISLSGQGSLSASPILPVTAGLAGTGTLSASPGFTGSASLSGQGSLTGSPTLAAAAGLSGLGSLSASPVVAATLTGLGTLSAGETIGWKAALSGQGSLTASPAFAASVSVSGAGTLTTAVLIRAPASLSGAGTLSASQVFAAAASMSGQGTLAAGVTFLYRAGLSGAGTLSASPGFAQTVALNGSGTLSLAPVVQVPAIMSGQGSLAAVSSFIAAISLTGAGTLTAFEAIYKQAVLSGQGSIITQAVIEAVQILAGLGTLGLAVPPTQSPPTPDQLWAIYQQKLAALQRLENLYREAVIAGGRSWAGIYFTPTWQAEGEADAAYNAWMQASGSGLPIQ